eukprot:6219012-Alexandrium_andersonii.AAC.1
MLRDPDANERYFGNNAVVIIGDAMNSFHAASWTATGEGGKAVILTREMVIAGAPAHVGGSPLPKNQDAVPRRDGWRSSVHQAIMWRLLNIS